MALMLGSLLLSAFMDEGSVGSTEPEAKEPFKLRQAKKKKDKVAKRRALSVWQSSNPNTADRTLSSLRP